jgi:hypothetical protein
MPELGTMRQAAVHTAVILTLRELKLGERCWTRTTLHTDHISGQFFVPNPTTDDRNIVRKYFATLAIRYGWREPVVSLAQKSHTIAVTMETTSSNPGKAMPL